MTKAEQRGRTTSLKLLAVFCLMHPRVLLAFFAMRVCKRLKDHNLKCCLDH